MNRRDLDWKPLALVPLLALIVLPLIGSPSTWLTLTVAGLAMGMIIFIIASGLTLVFGLMDVLNFGHGVFIALGAFVATSVLGAMGDWTGSAELWRNLVAVLPAMLVAMAVAGALGLAFERFIVRPVYGQHLKQILITMGGMIIGEELIKVIWSLWPWAWWCSACWPGRSRAPRWACSSARACRTARWSSRSATASGACLWACSWRARRWQAWAA